MNENIKVFGSEKFMNEIADLNNPVFLCVMSNTGVSKIPDITGAGSPEFTAYTPALDAEVILKDTVLSLPEIATTDNGNLAAPSPALLAKATIDILDIPFIAINAGLEVTPQTPYVELNGVPGGDLREGKGVEDPEKIFENAKFFAEQMSQVADHLIIGESTPAGTTTALGLLTALGYDAKYKVSGCMMTNPHELKNSVVDKALEVHGLKPGDLADDAFKAVAIAGDPTMIAVAGLMAGSSVPVILAGGSQMTAPCAIIKALDPDYDFSNMCIATTSYVANDETANLIDIVNQIGDITVYAADPLLENSSVEGLINYSKGAVKEGVGAGGAIFYAYVKGVTSEDYIAQAEEITKKHFA